MASFDKVQNQLGMVISGVNFMNIYSIFQFTFHMCNYFGIQSAISSVSPINARLHLVAHSDVQRKNGIGAFGLHTFIPMDDFVSQNSIQAKCLPHQKKRSIKSLSVGYVGNHAKAHPTTDDVL